MSFGLRALSGDARQAMIADLWAAQNGKCFISEKVIDLKLHLDDLDIDHVIPTRDGGKDDRSNWALAFSHYNRSKQATDLRVARVLCRFEALKADVTDARGINLGHVLKAHGGSSFSLPIEIKDQTIRFALAKLGESELQSVPIWRDELSGLEHCFVELPIEYLHHDDRLNPRGIGTNIRGLIIEFFQKFPQLHVPLAWIDPSEQGGVKVRIFDGQHKAAAQVLLGVRKFPVRIFVDPDPDLLLTANTHAGTSLRQVAFDKATQRHLGASIYNERIERFRIERGLAANYTSFTEQQLVDHFRGEQAQMRRYVIDAQRNDITYHSDNRLRDFIEMGGKGTERPLSYSALEKAVYSQSIFGKMLETPDDHGIETGDNARDLERDQIVRLLNIVADRIFVGHWNPEIGSGKLEDKVRAKVDVPENHLRAHRMAREEVMQAWFELVMSVCQTIVISTGKPWDRERPFHRLLPETLWGTVDRFVCSLAELPLWKDRASAETTFGGKQNVQFWKQAFATGIAGGTIVLPGGGLNLIEMMKAPG